MGTLRHITSLGHKWRNVRQRRLLPQVCVGMCIMERTVWSSRRVCTVSTVITAIASLHVAGCVACAKGRWTVIVNIIYLLFSFLGMVLPNENKIITNLTLALFSLSADMGVIVILVYWLAVWDGYTLRFCNIMTHGGIFACIVIDGL
eukprot:9743358-Ditylum_brightwellii.AAC.1